MYIYDTRNEYNYKSFPINGWFFPCITCKNITGQYKMQYTCKFNLFNFIHVKIPFCKKCDKLDKIIPKLKVKKIKYLCEL